MKKSIAVILAIALIATLFAGCGLNVGKKSSDKLQIVATIFPLFDFARQIAGNKAEVTLLLPPGAESHSYEPTPQDMIKIQNCDLFLYIGGESDSWVDDMLESMETPVKSLKLIERITAIEEEIVEGMEQEQEQEQEGEEKEYDEHIWTSPKNAKIMAIEIAAALCTVNEENTELYDANSASYLAKLDELDSDFKGFFSGVQNKTLVFGDRFPLLYFAKEYGLKYYAAFPGCSSETEPSAATIAFLINKVKSEKIGTVFYLEFSNHLVADSIAADTGAKTALYHSCHNVSNDEINAGATYLNLMQKNLETLKGALK